MSIEALRWALEEGEARGLEPTQRHILLVLGNRADERGYLWPSIAWICQRTGLSRRTVQAHMSAMEAAGILRRDQRPDGVGGRTSDGMWLGVQQPGLPLPDPRAEFALGGAPAAPPPAQNLRPPRAAAAPYTQDHKQEVGGGRGVKKPTPQTPTAECFEAYQQGIRQLYKAEYPPSARANGILSQMVGRLGGPQAVAVVRYFLSSKRPYYVTRQHALEVLAKDATELYLEMQRNSLSGEGKLPTKSTAYLVLTGGKELMLDDYPVGDHLSIARRVRADYANMIAAKKATSIAVRVGAERRTFTIQEAA